MGGPTGARRTGGGPWRRGRSSLGGRGPESGKCAATASAEKKKNARQV